MGRWVAWLLLGRPIEDAVAGAAPPRRVRPRGLLLYVFAVSLTVAAVAGIAAVTGGSLGIDHLRILATSLAFAVFSATSAAGSSARREGRGAAAFLVGIATIVLSGIALFTLMEVIWDLDRGALRSFGTAALLTLAASHASLVLRARRPDDSAAVRVLAAASILLATLDCGGGALAVQDTRFWVRDYDLLGKAAAAVVIAMLLTTALQPILRAAGRARARQARPGAATGVGVGFGRPGAATIGALGVAGVGPSDEAPALRTVAAALRPPPPPPPPPPTRFDSRLAPAIACGLALLVGVGGYMIGLSRKRVEHVPAAAPYAQPPAVAYAPPMPAPAVYQPSAPPPQPPDDPMRPPKLPAVLQLGKPHALPLDVRPSELFKCGSMGERHAELRRGSRISGLDRIEMHRGPRGLCLRLSGSAVARLHAPGGGQTAIGIAFYRPGKPRNRAAAYRFILASLPDNSGTYWMKFQPPGPNPVVSAHRIKAARLGSLGMSSRQASVLITAPLMPRWVNDPNATWEATSSG